jgi:hypothetical protein
LIARYVSMAVFLALVVLVAAIGGSFMAPYLVWLVFIWALSLTIWTMNGGPFSSLLLYASGLLHLFTLGIACGYCKCVCNQGIHIVASQCVQERQKLFAFHHAEV